MRRVVTGAAPPLSALAPAMQATSTAERMGVEMEPAAGLGIRSIAAGADALRSLVSLSPRSEHSYGKSPSSVLLQYCFAVLFMVQMHSCFSPRLVKNCPQVGSADESLHEYGTC